MNAELPERVAAVVADLAGYEGAEGILLVGSASRSYKDAHSDYDLELILTDAAYQELPVDRRWQRVLADPSTEYLAMPQAELDAKKTSPRDWDHWRYEQGRILHDPHGLMARTLPLVAEMAPAIRNARVRVYYFECLLHLVKLSVDRGVELNARASGGALALSALKLTFSLAGRWAPAPGWSAQNLAELGAAPELRSALLAVLREPNPRAARVLGSALDAAVLAAGFDYPMHKVELVVDVGSTSAGRSERERFSLL